MRIRLLVLLALVCMAPMHDAFAQKKMYRCGSQYQDRPCEAGAPAQPAAKSAEKSVNALN